MIGCESSNADAMGALPFGDVAVLERPVTGGTLQVAELELAERPRVMYGIQPEVLTESSTVADEQADLTTPANAEFNALPSASTERPRRKLREWIAGTWAGRIAAATTMATTFFAANAALEAAPAQATTITYPVYNTGGDSLWLHPSSPTLDSTLSDLMPDGTDFTISCWADGDNVNGDVVWDYGTNKSTGNTGYAADYYVDTPTTEGNESTQLLNMGVPECGSTAPAPANASPGSSTPPANPSTPNYSGSCKQNVGAELVESWDDVLSTIGDDGEFTSQLEQWDLDWGNPGEDDVCIGADLSNETSSGQFVGSVAAVSPDTDPPGCGTEDLIEVWGNGFYDKTNCTGPTEWTINMQLKAGSWICAAISSAYDTGAYSTPAAAEAAVADGQAPMGAADPYREVTCVPVS